MKKILVISNTSFSIEKFRSHYLNKLSSKYHIKVLTPSEKPSNLSKKINFKQLKNINLINLFFKLKKEIIFFKPNKIIIYSWKYQFYMSLLNFICKDVEVIYVIAGGGSLFLNNNIFLKFGLFKVVKNILEKPNKVIFINPYDKIWFEKNFKILGKTYLIPTEGIELIRKKSKVNYKKNFIFFGRLIKQKGIIEYLELASILKKKDKYLNFYIAGPIDQSVIGDSKVPDNLFNKIKSNQNVNYLGNIKSFKNIFPKMDCLISPSYTEGAGTSVMEAMSSGLYVIAYKNNGHNYLLKNTKNYLCKENTINELINGYEHFKKKTQDELSHNYKISYQKIKIKFSSKKSLQEIKKILLDFPYTITHITRKFENIYGGIEQVISNMQNSNKYLKQNVISFSNFNKVKKLENNNKSYIFKETFSIFGDPFSISAMSFIKNSKDKNNIIIYHYPTLFSLIYIILWLRNNLTILVYHSDVTKFKIFKPLIDLHLKLLNIFVDKYYISSSLYLKNSNIKNFYEKTIQEYFSINLKRNYLKRDYKIPFKKYVIFIGKDRHYKGFEYLEKIISLNQDVNFVCITDHNMVLKKNLKIFSHIDENFKKYLIKNAEILISTSNSKSESYGINLLEGLFLDKPLIAFDLRTGVNDIIKNNKNGFLIKKFDIYQYSRMIKKLYNNKNFNKKFSLFSNNHKVNFKKNYKKLFNFINQR